VFGCGAAEVEHGSLPTGVALDQCLWVQPKTGKYLRAVDPVRAWRQFDEATFPPHEPEHLVGLERTYNIFQYSDALVVFKLRA
jgi:hypothetical protein